MTDSLRTHAPWRVLDGFGGGAVRAAARYAAPETLDDLRAVAAQARAEGLTITFRGAGRSYGDAALSAGGLVLDLQRLNRIRSWTPETGILNAEPGVTIEDVWRRTLPDGFWPHVVPGTMRPTLGGCLSTNIHGKNNYAVGSFGDHVLDFDLLTTRGDLLTCSRTSHPDVFFAAVGGLGLLGAVTRLRMTLKRVETGDLQVTALAGRSLDELMDRFEACLPTNDYTVGWLDGLARGRRLGRGIIHCARYLPAAEVPDAARTLQLDHQELPGAFFAVPGQHVWRLMRPFMFDPAVRLINAGKYHLGRLQDGTTYRQSHVAFAFLLDYLPDWRLAYGRDGFIQYQVFVPAATARATLAGVLAHSLARGLPPYLCVLKRHRPDDFLLSYAVDGWSLAMDFPVRASTRPALWQLTNELTELVLAAGGRFYFAKDAVLRPDDVERAYGRERLERFAAIKQQLDPDLLLTNELWLRVTAGRERWAPSAAPLA